MDGDKLTFDEILLCSVKFKRLNTSAWKTIYLTVRKHA